MPWPTIEIFLLFILVAMLQIKKVTITNPRIYPLLHLSFTPLCCLTNPLHSVLFFPPENVLCLLPPVDLIEKRAHITLEILNLQNVALRHCLFGRAPLCFTSDNQMKRADSLLFADLFPSFLKHTSSSSFVECWPNQTGLKPGLLGRLNHLLAVWLDSKCLSACVSHSAAALCVCVSDSRTATYCVVLVFAFEKAATVSLVVVQQ